MPSFSSLLGAVADEFTERRRRGENPSVSDYVSRHPEIADLLRDILPMLVAAGPADGVATPSFTDAHPSSASSTPGYEILGELGRGGMGVVYRAKQSALGRETALKMILPGAAVGAGELVRFAQEAKAIAALQHPGIVTVFEIGDQGGRPFFSLELCEGGSLSSRLDAGPLEPLEAARVVAELAVAAEAAHRAGIVHRDLKPANVLRTRDGVYKISDFGLVKRTEVPSEVSQSGLILGTPSYMPPEQALGRTDVDHRADVYSLGAILYECLTGRPPFRAASVFDTLAQVLHAEPVPPTALNPRVPRDLDTICRKCLHKDAARRYSSAADLADDLSRFLAGRPILARPVSSLEVVAKWARRNRALSSLLAMTVVGTLFALGVFAWLWQDAEASAESARINERREEAARKDAEKAEGEAKTSAAAERRASYLRNIALVDRQWRAGNARQAESLLSECPPELRGWEWRHMWHRIRGLDAGVLLQHVRSYQAVAVSPDGRTCAVAAGSAVSFFDPKDRKFVGTTVRVPSESVVALAYAPDGRTVLACGEMTGEPGMFRKGQTHRIDAATHKVVATAQGGRAAAFRPDGLVYAVCSTDAGVILYDAATNKRLAKFTDQPADSHCVAFSAGGDVLAAGDDFGNLLLRSRPGGGLVEEAASLVGLSPSPMVALAMARARASLPYGPARRIDVHTGMVHAVAIDPTGRRVATSGSDQRIKLTDVTTGKTWTEVSDDGWVMSLAWLPTGDRLVSGGYSGLVRVWEPMRPAEVESMPGHFAPIRSVAVGPDGTIYTASLDGSFRRWRLGDSPGTRRLFDPAISTRQAVSAGEGAYVSLATDGRVHLWDAATGKARLLGTHAKMLMRVVADRAGTLAATLDVDGGLVVWDLAGSAPPKRFAGPKPTALGCALALSEDAETIYAGLGGEVIAWTIATGERAATFEVPRELKGGMIGMTGLDLDEKAGTLTVVGVGSTMCKWRLRGGEVLRAQSGSAAATGAAVRPGSGLLAVGGAALNRTGRIGFLDRETFEERRLLDGLPSPVATLTFSPDGRLLATGGMDLRVTLWDPDGGRELMNFSPRGGTVLSLAFDEKMSRLAAGCTEGGIRLFDGPASGQRFVLRAASPQTAVAAHAPSATLVVGDLRGTVVVRDLKTSTERFRVMPADAVRGLALSSDGKRYALVGGRIRDRGEVQLLSATDPADRRLFPAEAADFWCGALSDTHLAAGAESGEVYLWNLADETPAPKILGAHGRRVRVVAFTPDGRHLLTSGRDGPVRVWDVATGEAVRTLAATAGVTGVGVRSPDGRIATADTSGHLTLWDADGRQRSRTPLAGLTTPECVAFSPDGRVVAVGTNDRRVHLHDAETGANVGFLSGHTHMVFSVAWPEAGTIVSAGYDGTARVWDVRR